MSEDEYARGYREGWYDAKAQAADRIEALEAALKEAGEMWVRKDNRIEQLEAALREIAAIEDQSWGEDWCEINEARGIARKALAPEQDK